MLCHRHTTSKLEKVEDLKEIQTFGFRGEALASISHVAHITITSLPPEQQLAYTLKYEDGKPDAKFNTGKPKAAAGTKGTKILVEDLFYNVPTRRKSIKNFNEEHQKIVQVVKCYALHNTGISFTCKQVRGKQRFKREAKNRKKKK
jgi:DNA mismatch repair protein MLH1